MSPRPDVSEKRKDQILEAASKVFAEKGVYEARMDDIVKKSGLSKGTLYWYFKSKEEIIFGIFENMFKREFAEIEKLEKSKVSAYESMMVITERVIEDIKKMLGLMPIAYEFISLAFRRKFIQEAFKRYFKAYLDILVPLIQRGIDSGEFKQVNPLDVAIASGAIFEGTILLWVYDNKIVKPDEHIRFGINLLLKGIQA